MKSYTYILENLTSLDRVEQIEKLLAKFNLANLKIDLLSSTLQFDAKSAKAQLVVKELRKIRQEVNLVECRLRQLSKRKTTTILTFFRFLASLIFLLVGLNIFPFAARVLFYACFLLLSYPSIIDIIIKFKNKKFLSIELLVITSALIAMINAYYIEALACVTIQAISFILQNNLVEPTCVSVNSLSTQSEDYVKILEQDFILKKGKDIAIGDKVFIDSGAKVMVDGIIHSGQAYFSTFYLDGLRRKVFLEEGDKVYAGLVLVDSAIILQATKTIKQSLINRINQDIYQERKFAKVNDFKLDLWQTIWIYVMWTAASLGLVLASIGAYSWQVFILLILATYPAPLVITVSTLIIAWQKTCFKKGVLVKKYSTLIDLARSKNIVSNVDHYLNKKMKIAKIVTTIDYQLFCQMFFALNKVGQLYRVDGESSIELESWQIEKGLGVVASYLNQQLLMGNRGILVKYGVDFKDEIEDGVYLAWNSKYIGCLELQEQLSSVAELKQQFKNIGINWHLATYTSFKVQQKLAQTYLVELASLEQDFSNSIYVGRCGLDAPKLVNAKVGVSLQQNYAVLNELADVILLNNNLADLIRVLKTSKSRLWQLKIWFAIWVILVVSQIVIALNHFDLAVFLIIDGLFICLGLAVSQII